MMTNNRMCTQTANAVMPVIGPSVAPRVRKSSQLNAVVCLYGIFCQVFLIALYNWDAKCLPSVVLSIAGLLLTIGHGSAVNRHFVMFCFYCWCTSFLSFLLCHNLH